ncbi:MAG: hypothetical protein QW222_07580 [Candidatus Bathyarchaeia archaeon]
MRIFVGAKVRIAIIVAAAELIIGSNLTDMTLVLGIALLASPLEIIELSIFAQNVPFVSLITLILLRYLTKGGISQLGGIALIVYIIFKQQ